MSGVGCVGLESAVGVKMSVGKKASQTRKNLRVDRGTNRVNK